MELYKFYRVLHLYPVIMIKRQHLDILCVYCESYSVCIFYIIIHVNNNNMFDVQCLINMQALADYASIILRKISDFEH